MKTAFLFGPISTGPRPFDWDRIDTDPRGLTGTDNSFLGYASAMAARGHEVTIYAARQRFRTTWRGCAVRPYEERRAIDASYDAALVWNDLAGLAEVDPSVLRVLDTQINDYTYTTPEQHANVDLYLAPSQGLVDRLAPMARAQGGLAPWRVAPNGCDPTVYDLSAKVPGRCIFASSPDRGLHIVLEQWMRIRGEVPWATLRIYYHSLGEWFGNIERNMRSHEWHEREHARRAVITRDLLSKLEAHGVEVIGGSSRRDMARAYSEAEVLAYPVDSLSFTEGFAVAILEGCASGAVPCVTSCDAIGDIYRGVCQMVEVPEGCHRFLDHPELAKGWSEDVITALKPFGQKGKEALAKVRATGRAFAEAHAWPVLAVQLERILGG